MKIFISTILLLLTQQAFSMSANKCQSTDWFAVGRETGVKGLPSDKIIKMQLGCQKKGVEISLDQYQKGWLMGIGQYCSHDNAFNLGFKKKSPSKFCPIDLRADFDQFYVWGKEAFALEKEIKSKENKLKGKVSNLKSVNKKKENLEKEIKNLEEQTKALNQKVDAIEEQMKKKRSIIKKAQ